MNVQPGATYEAVLESGITGLVGTIKLGLVDNQGATTQALSSSSIIETPVGSGVYAATRTAPTVAGQYTLVWSLDGTTDPDQVSTDDLLVTSSATSPPVPAGRDLCALDDVLRYLPGYESDDDTDATLQALITKVSIDVYERVGREFTSRGDDDPRLFEITPWEQEEREVTVGDVASLDGGEVLILSEDMSVLQTLQAGAYVALPRSRDAWEPITTLRFPRAVQSPAETARLPLRGLVQVTAAWGFPSIPVNVREGVAMLVIHRYLTSVADTGTAFTDAVENINVGGLLRAGWETLDDYRVPVAG